MIISLGSFSFVLNSNSTTLREKERSAEEGWNKNGKSERSIVLFSSSSLSSSGRSSKSRCLSLARALLHLF